MPLRMGWVRWGWPGGLLILSGGVLVAPGELPDTPAPGSAPEQGLRDALANVQLTCFPLRATFYFLTCTASQPPWASCHLATPAKVDKERSGTWSGDSAVLVAAYIIDFSYCREIRIRVDRVAFKCGCCVDTIKSRNSLYLNALPSTPASFFRCSICTRALCKSVAQLR